MGYLTWVIRLNSKHYNIILSPNNKYLPYLRHCIENKCHKSCIAVLFVGCSLLPHSFSFCLANGFDCSSFRCTHHLKTNRCDNNMNIKHAPPTIIVQAATAFHFRCYGRLLSNFLSMNIYIQNISQRIAVKTRITLHVVWLLASFCMTPYKAATQD